MTPVGKFAPLRHFLRSAEPSSQRQQSVIRAAQPVNLRHHPGGENKPSKLPTGTKLDVLYNSGKDVFTDRGGTLMKCHSEAKLILK